MPLQNRVLPTAEIVTTQHRGHYMGNRGILHNDTKSLQTARWKHKAWIICVLEFKNRQRQLMKPNRYTELFFYDEATALAAGHRPCAECQRKRFNDYQAHWEKAFGVKAKAGDMDKCLHKSRVVSHSRTQILTEASYQDIPNGCFILWEGKAHLKWDDHLHLWTWEGYGPDIRVTGNPSIKMITPEPTAKVIAAGYQPDIIGL